jgi:integrase
MNRRANGDGGLSWDQRRQRWIAATTVGYDGRGKRIVRRGSGRTKTEAKAKLRALLRDRDDGVVLGAEGYTVGQAVDDWLAFGMGKRAESTVRKYRLLCSKHIIPLLGARKLRELTAPEVERWLARLAKSLSTDTLHRVHACLDRSVKRAMARDLVRRNVVELAEIPTGRPGRQSKSLTPEQVDGVLIKTAPNRLHNYIVVSLLTGGRTEELRALRWDHVHLDAAPPHIEVWRSVRADGDTKTRRSRRTLALPARCVDALKKQRAQQLADRLSAGDRWQENGLVFATSVGTKMLAGNVRRDFRRALALVPGIDPSMWTPRELRHSFVSVLSDAGVPLEEISQLVGHSGTTVTELVYRHQLKPVIQTGATVMDRLFGA